MHLEKTSNVGTYWTILDKAKKKLLYWLEWYLEDSLLLPQTGGTKNRENFTNCYCWVCCHGNTGLTLPRLLVMSCSGLVWGWDPTTLMQVLNWGYFFRQLHSWLQASFVNFLGRCRAISQLLLYHLGPPLKQIAILQQKKKTLGDSTGLVAADSVTVTRSGREWWRPKSIPIPRPPWIILHYRPYVLQDSGYCCVEIWLGSGNQSLADHLATSGRPSSPVILLPPLACTKFEFALQDLLSQST